MAEVFDESFAEMARKTYTPLLMDALQDATQKVVDCMTPLENCTGEKHEYNGIGKTELVPRQSPIEEKKRDEVPFNRRFILPSFWAKTLVMSADVLKIKGKFAANATDFIRVLQKAVKRNAEAVALGVAWDKAKGNYVIADYDTYSEDATDGSIYKGGATGGIMGPNYIGKAGVTKEALPLFPNVFGSDGAELATAYSAYTGDNLDFKETNIIPHNYVESGSLIESGLTPEKLMAVRLAFVERSAIEEDEEIYMAVTPKQMHKLIQDPRLQNSQSGFQVLKDGYIKKMQGINFIVSPKVPVVNIGTAQSPKWVRCCPAWLKEEVRWGAWESPTFDVVKLDQTHYDAIDISVQCAYGAGRCRKETVINTLCDEGLSF